MGWYFQEMPAAAFVSIFHEDTWLLLALDHSVGFFIKHSSDLHIGKKYKFRFPTRARNTITWWERAVPPTVG